MDQKTYEFDLEVKVNIGEVILINKEKLKEDLLERQIGTLEVYREYEQIAKNEVNEEMKQKYKEIAQANYGMYCAYKGLYDLIIDGEYDNENSNLGSKKSIQ